MKESTLWGHLRPELERHGKFQKTNDRFTLGIPDVIGMSTGVGYALELKELGGVRVLSTKFRPGQVDWLRDWEASGGVSWVVSTHLQTLYVHPWGFAEALIGGVSPLEVENASQMVFSKSRKTLWQDCVSQLLLLRRNTTMAPKSKISRLLLKFS